MYGTKNGFIMNLSENEIIRYIAYDTADACISANAVIVPIAVEQ